MNYKYKRKNTILTVILSMLICCFFAGCSVSEGATIVKESSETSIVKDNISISDVPKYSGSAYVELNNNIPEFSPGEIRAAKESFEDYGMLDSFGRCTVATASLSVDTQPGGNEERGDISSIHPTGWHSGMGWERCHLIGWQLCAENANEKNLVTGTHYMNVTGMLPFENEIDWYISETGNHVLYSVEPVFSGEELICRGVHMQALSVEDDGNGVSFNVFCYNVLPGSSIDYMTGVVTSENASANEEKEVTYILNTSSRKFHEPSCSSVTDMAEHNKKEVSATRDELIKEGYDPCGNCKP